MKRHIKLIKNYLKPLKRDDVHDGLSINVIKKCFGELYEPLNKVFI